MPLFLCMESGDAFIVVGDGINDIGNEAVSFVSDVG